MLMEFIHMYFFLQIQRLLNFLTAVLEIRIE